MKNSSDKQNDNELRQTAKGFLIYAKDYSSAYCIIKEKSPSLSELFSVKYFLALRALELAMKSILRDEGYTIIQLKNIGHDLKKLKNKLLNTKYGYVLDSFDIEIIDFSNRIYEAKEYEYHKTGYKQVPDVNQVMVTVQKIIAEADDIIEKPRGYLSNYS